MLERIFGPTNGVQGKVSAVCNKQGDENLEVMKFAPNYMNHVGSLVKSWLPDRGQIIEFGSGNGIQTLQIEPPSARLTCIESSASQRDALKLLGYKVAPDLSELGVSSVVAVFSLNCLEHIEDDHGFLCQLDSFLAPNALVVLYVPALPVLFSKMDAQVGHFRRYTRRGLTKLLSESGLKVIKIGYVDCLGVLPSMLYKLNPWASGHPTSQSVHLYDKYLFPVSKKLDRLFGHCFGKNLLVIGIRK